MFSSWKSDREGHCVDGFSDGLFRYVIYTRFRRRSKVQISCVLYLLERILDVHGEWSMRATILTGDRRYGYDSYMNMIHGLMSSYIFTVSHQRNVPHLFLAVSRMNGRNFDEEACL